MDVEQGNIINDEMLHRLHTGMSKQQVRDLMGSPVLVNTFNDDRMDYVYTNKPGRGQFVEKYVTLVFRHDRLVEVGGNLYSVYMR